MPLPRSTTAATPGFEGGDDGLNQVPEEYAECFAILGEHGILPQDLSQDLQQMARFRNMLVHVYWKIDYDQVYRILQEHLDDLRAFVRAIGELL